MIDAEFLALVNQFGRVTVLKRDETKTLPLDIRAIIAGKVQWLRREIPKMDLELDVVYPPIQIVPVSWIHQLENGTSGRVHGRVIPRKRGQDVLFTVELSMASLWAFSEELTIGVLAHEVLHYVKNTFDCHHNVGEGVVTINKPLPGYTESFERYHEIDRDDQVEPAQWLSARLAALAARAEDENDPGVVSGLAKLREWQALGYPTEQINLSYEVSGSINLDERLLEERGTQ